MWQAQARYFQPKGTSTKALRQDKLGLFREPKENQCGWSRVRKGRKTGDEIREVVRPDLLGP